MSAIRERFANLQNATKLEDFTKENAKPEEVALFVLKTFGQCYFEKVKTSFKWELFQKKLQYEFTVSNGVYDQLKVNKFGEFLQSSASTKSVTASLTALGNDYIHRVLDLPWAVQKVRAIPNVSSQWPLVDSLITEKESEEQELDDLLLTVIQKLSIEEEDVCDLERYLLSPVAMRGNEFVSVYALLLSWLKQYPQSNVEAFLKQKFSFLEHMKIEVFVFRYTVYEAKISSKDMKMAESSSNKASSIVSFSDFRVSFLMDCICTNLKISSFCDGSQFTLEFYKYVQTLLKESVVSRKEAIFNAGVTVHVPSKVDLQRFLDACERFIIFRQKFKISENISFMLEWFMWSNKEITFPVNETACKESMENLRKCVEDTSVTTVYRIELMISLYSSVGSFRFFKELTDRRWFGINDMFLSEFLKKNIRIESYPNLVIGCGYVVDIVKNNVGKIYYCTSFWVIICDYIDKQGLPALKELMGQFAKEVPYIQSLETLRMKYADCYIEVCLLYLKSLLYRKYIKEANTFITQVLKRTFLEEQMFLLQDSIRRSMPFLSVAKNDENCPFLKKALENQAAAHKLLQAMDTSKMLEPALRELYIQTINNQK